MSQQEPEPFLESSSPLRAGKLPLPVLISVLLSGLVAFSAYLVTGKGEPPRTRVPELAPLSETAAAQPPALREVSGTFAKNQSITGALAEHGLPQIDIQGIIDGARAVHDLRQVFSGRPYFIYFNGDGSVHDFRCAIDRERYLTVYRDGNRFVAVMKRFRVVVEVEQVTGTVEGSLLSSITQLGEQEVLALQFAEVFSWDVDFYTDIRRGDTFRLIVEKKYLEGKFAGYGEILAATLRQGGKSLTGIRFETEPGKFGYYTPDGRPLQRSFLKSPLKFARISSRFSRARRHPILRIVRPHLGVDYAAPVGTRVQAVASGVVMRAGYAGEGGRMVWLRHERSYETVYMHLSRVFVRVGERVEQGQVVGEVGASGLTTGPHLDFRVLLHGRYVNPSRVVFPPLPPISPTAYPRFAALRDRLHGALEAVMAE